MFTRKIRHKNSMMVCRVFKCRPKDLYFHTKRKVFTKTLLKWKKRPVPEIEIVWAPPVVAISKRCLERFKGKE